MELKARVTVRGAKTWVGNMDGKQLDTGTIYADVELRGEGSKGCFTQAIKCHDSEVVKKIINNPFPFLAELNMVVTSNGKQDGDQQICTQIVPLQRVVEGDKAK
ncbi:hypothetical protein LMG19087_02148 [Ralstonia wenshanensis]|jgi:hypothetical protein|uniref:hypothetical protein n=1 Tax=Ralstonia wenshanensis TaxID=2842456 RepID=UPI0028F530B7|nr:hypothetical protein [Ralstonia wenshanensis]CAJ0814575.1 hypothetical protein LMG19087_02148 [Ralstonia wenshanensis]